MERYGTPPVPKIGRLEEKHRISTELRCWTRQTWTAKGNVDAAIGAQSRRGSAGRALPSCRGGQPDYTLNPIRSSLLQPHVDCLAHRLVSTRRMTIAGQLAVREEARLVPKPPGLRQVGHIAVFVSSSSEAGATHLRAEIERHSQRININLREADQPFHLDLFHWWQVPPQKARKGQVNQIFVERALASQAVIALLVKYLRPGTKEEIKYAYTSNVPMSVFYCPPHGNPNAHRKLRRFLRWLRTTNLYNQAGDPHGQRASDALRDVLLDIVLRQGRLTADPVAYESR